MASTAYDQSIRSALNQKGINNSQIGYKNGYVTVNGQNFMKADKTYNGSAYTSAQNFNNAWNNYSTPKPTPSTTTPTYKPPTVTPGSVAVRPALESAGYNPSSIGYNNGTVTLNNQPFVVPTTNANGTTYTDQKTFNNALSNQRIGDLQTKIYNNTNLPTNQYTQKVDDTIQYLMDFAKNQQVSDPRQSAEYAAYQAQADRRAQQGIRAAQESMGSSGFGRSTALGERAQGIQNQQEEYLETQVIPTLLAAERERQQQQYNNVINLLSPLMSQQSYADNRAQTELGNVYNALGAITSEQQRGYDNARADAALTGYYISPEAQQAINALLSLKQQAEAKGISAQDKAALSQQADSIRALLPQYGVDPSQFAAGVNFNDASKVKVGRTLQGQQLDMQNEQFAYQKARDAISDQQWKMQFDEAVRQNGLSYGLNLLQEQNQQAYREASLALSQDDNARAWAQFDWDMSNPSSSGSSRGLTANQVLESMKSLYNEPVYTTDEFGNQTKTGSKITTDPAKREQMFLNVVDSDLSDVETNQILQSLGMTKTEIDGYMKKYGAASGN